MIVKEERVNLGRQREFDIVKALAILFMITIHVYEELSAADATVICSRPLDIILQFLGGPFAAPVFMFSLGLGLSYSSHRSPGELMKRGLYLFLFSYAFNLIRFTLPLLLAYGFVVSDPSEVIYSVFHVDILTFAGMTFLLIGFLKKLNVPVYGVAILAVVMQAVGSILAGTVSADSEFAVYLGAIFIKTGVPSYFPFFQWFIYPALGLLYAKYLRHVEDTDKLYLTLFGVSASLMLSLCAALYTFGIDVRTMFMLAEESFYAQTFLHTSFALLCILLELSVVHFILKAVHLPKLGSVFSFMSGKLNQIYIVQWILIGWIGALAVSEETCLPVALIVPVGIVLTAISTLFVFFCQSYRNKKKTEKKPADN